MNCAQHVQTPAVGQCHQCGRGLCGECLNAYEPPTCPNCVGGLVKEEKSSATKELVVSAILFFFGASIGCEAGKSDPFLGTNAFVSGMVMGYTFAAVPWGWRSLTAITPRVFLFLPLAGWVAYFVIKLSLAVMVGFFVVPFKVWGAVSRMRAARALQT